MNVRPAATPDLEARIQSALVERALAYEPSEIQREVDPGRARQPSPWRPLLIGAGVVIVIAAAVVWFATRTTSDSEPLGPTEATISVPTDAGTEIPLRQVEPSPYLESTLTSPVDRQVPGASAFTLAPGDGEPVLFSRKVQASSNQPALCVTMQKPPDPVSEYRATSTCGGEVLQLFHYPHAGSEADQTVYYAWPNVPPETAYVTFESELLRAWQQPLHHAVLFPVPDGPTNGVLRAFAADGTSLAEVPVLESMNGSGNPPTQSWTSPAGQGKKAECDAHPLAGGDIQVYDHAIGQAVTLPFRDLCYEQADLVPDDQALQRVGVTASFTFENGHVKVTYHEDVVTLEDDRETHTTGPELSPEEVWLRLAKDQPSR